MKRLSSEVTLVYQVVYPILFSFLTVIVFLTLLNGGMSGRGGQPPPSYTKWLVLAGGGLATIWAIAQALMIQCVSIEDNKLKVSGLWCVDEIGIESIESIRETRFRNPKLVIVRLRIKSKFGKTLRFIPRGKGPFFGAHPVVSMLAAEVKQ